MSTMQNDTERAILTAAEQEFMLTGYGGARTTAIAEKAGVTHAMLHYYYRTKDSLFNRIIEEKAAELLNQVLALFSTVEHTSFADKICHVVERHFDMLVQNPLLPGFVLTELRNNPERLEGWFTKIGDAVKMLAPDLQAEVERVSAEGTICHLPVQALLSDIVFLNISSVGFADVFCRIFGQDKDAYLEMRRKENVETIRKRLLP